MIQQMLAIWSLVPLPFLNPFKVLPPYPRRITFNNPGGHLKLQIIQNPSIYIYIYIHIYTHTHTLHFFLIIYTVKGFSTVNEAEIGVFLEFSVVVDLYKIVIDLYKIVIQVYYYHHHNQPFIKHLLCVSHCIKYIFSPWNIIITTGIVFIFLFPKWANWALESMYYLLSMDS